MSDLFGTSTETKRAPSPPRDADQDGKLPYSIPLNLVVHDPDVIRALVQHDDEDERNQYALEALKIGILALRHVGGHATGDMIQRESARLVRDMQQAFGQHKQLLHDRLENSLKEYFDPQNGRFSERVQRLVGDDGELTKLMCSLIDGENSRLARTLLVHVGRDSALMKQLDPQQSDGLLATLTKTIEEQLKQQRDHVLKQFSLDEEQSALRKLKRELQEVLDANEKKNQVFQEEVKTSLARMVTTRQEVERSTRHGFIFQEAVFEFLAREAQHAGDVATPTANVTGSIRNCKVGDCLIELGPDSAAPGSKIVIEVKEEAGVTLAKAREEIEVARKNRDADWGLFVFSSKTAPAGLDPFQRYGNDFIVVWNAEDPTSDVFLKAGVIAARALCFRAHRQTETCQADFQSIDKAILEIERRSQNLDEVRKSAETIQSASTKILERVRIDREALDKQVAILREKIGEVRGSLQSP
jgi:hypothetical protein